MPRYVVEFSPEVAAADVNAVLTRTVQLATLRAEQVARDGAPRDTATLARSITSEVHGLSARVYSPLVYAGVMEAGRRPGAKMPPPAALAGWARRHGYTGSLWVLARNIGRYGSPRNRARMFFFRAAAQTIEAELPSILQRAVAESEG
jgi:hypothetical protein